MGQITNQSQDEGRSNSSHTCSSFLWGTNSYKKKCKPKQKSSSWLVQVKNSTWSKVSPCKMSSSDASVKRYNKSCHCLHNLYGWCLVFNCSSAEWKGNNKTVNCMVSCLIFIILKRRSSCRAVESKARRRKHPAQIQERAAPHERCDPTPARWRCWALPGTNELRSHRTSTRAHLELLEQKYKNCLQQCKDQSNMLKKFKKEIYPNINLLQKKEEEKKIQRWKS